MILIYKIVRFGFKTPLLSLPMRGYFLPGFCQKGSYFVPGTKYAAFGTLYTPQKLPTKVWRYQKQGAWGTRFKLHAQPVNK